MPADLPLRLLEILVAGPPLLLLAVAAVPAALADAHPRAIGRLVTALLAAGLGGGGAEGGGWGGWGK
jgi:hypothetical protein